MSTDSDTVEPRDLDLASFLRKQFAKHDVEMHTILPARITKYDATKQVAECQILIMKKYTNEQNAIISEAMAPIPNVPVIFPGAGKYRITFPIEVGTVMKLVCCEASLDEWWHSDGSQIVNPRDGHRFSVVDSMLECGLHPITKPWTGVSTDHMTAGADGGLQIHFFTDHLGLTGEAPTDHVALASKVMTALNSLKTVFSSWVPAPNDGGGELKTGLTTLISSGWPVDVKSVKVQAD